ncbi:MAG: S-layer homology domain-containing protein, partial [Clostridiales bacterium]|nr:S-layer homology domain-containing protein [Clostridiales bacterium]
MKRFVLLFLMLVMSAQTAAAQQEDYISRAFAEGIIVGDENGNFDGDKQATRAEFAAIAVRFLKLSGGVNVFSDVSDSDWFADSVAAAAANGMLFGYEDGRMRPDEPIKCEDAVTIIGRFYEAEASGIGLHSVSPYARRYYAYALEHDLFTSWQFSNPAHNITKSEILSLLYRYSQQDLLRVNFINGSPRLSDNGVFNNISLELETNMPCTVYYAAVEADGAAVVPDKILCAVPAADTKVKANIFAGLNNKYDVYLRAVTKDNVSRRAVLKNVRAFAFSSGDGSSVNPYVIYSSLQLEQIAEHPDKEYILKSDIDVDGVWTPVQGFSGVLDGNGYKISGIKINSNDENVGLFAVLEGGTVKNLTVDAEITAKRNVGIIAGINDGGIIEGCTVTGAVSAKTGSGGGICGSNSGTVVDCLSAVKSVSAGVCAGGIAGQNYSGISRCLSACESVTSDMYAGGVAGSNTGGEVEKCAAVNMTVYNSMTKNSGRITTNREGGITRDNYAYDRTDTNAAAEEESRFSQNGFDTQWDKFLSRDFYREIGWNMNKWAKADNGFRLIYPKSSAQPVLEVGESAYFPKVIESANDLLEMGRNSAGHYILGRDITMKLPWKTVCGLVGFSGTLDGNGHTIYNLELKGESGIFSNISGGTVRNLNLVNVKASPNENGAVIAACNYGFIENCTVRGQLTTAKAGSVGIIAGQNNGQINNCIVSCDISQNSDNAVVGGICSDNSGIISGCSYSGRININGKSAAVGGICGYDADGYLIESFASVDITVKKSDSYIGGICGISSGTQFYKCSSNGSISAEGGSVYAGGIAGIAEDSAVYNCFSALNEDISSQVAYAGGICGYISGSNVQNTYSCSGIDVNGEKAYAGGICAFAENGFIMQNVSLCPHINSS